MLTDIEIAKSVKLRPINEVAAELGIHEDQVENYGRYIAKITTARIDRNKFKNHHLILVTAFKPQDIKNYTLVVWYEGTDPQCLDENAITLNDISLTFSKAN